VTSTMVVPLFLISTSASRRPVSPAASRLAFG
jgi:hypothetical protein